MSEVIDVLGRCVSEIWGLSSGRGWALIAPSVFLLMSVLIILVQTRLVSGTSKSRMGIVDPLVWLRAFKVLYEHLTFPWVWVMSALIPTAVLKQGQLLHAFNANGLNWELYRVPSTEDTPAPAGHDNWFLARPAAHGSLLSVIMANGHVKEDFPPEQLVDMAAKQAQRRSIAGASMWAGIVFVASQFGDDGYPVSVALLWAGGASMACYWWFRFRMRLQQGRYEWPTKPGGGQEPRQPSPDGPAPMAAHTTGPGQRWSVALDVKVVNSAGERHFYHTALIPQPPSAQVGAEGVHLTLARFQARNPHGVAVALHDPGTQEELLACFVPVDAPFAPAEDQVDVSWAAHPALPSAEQIAAGLTPETGL